MIYMNLLKKIFNKIKRERIYDRQLFVIIFLINPSPVSNRNKV